MKSPITTHILDTALGKPAAQICVALDKCVNGEWIEVSRKTTNDDGRIADLMNEPLAAISYRLTFDVKSYFDRTNRESFFPQVVIEFSIQNTEQHYHVPLLLSPFGYSTYRGS